MTTTPIWNLPLPTDGQTPWGDDYRTALGIIDANGFQSRGSMFAEGNATATTFTAPATFVKANVTTVEGPPCFCFEHDANRMTYVYGLPRVLTVWSTVRMSTGSANATMLAEVRKNGEHVVGGRGTTQRGNVNDSGSLTIVCNVEAEDGDFFELWVANPSGTAPITVVDLSLVLRG